MKVKLKEKSPDLECEDVNMGEVFVCKSNPDVCLMKTQIIGNQYGKINAVNVKNGELVGIKQTEPIIKINCELVEL